MRVLVRADASLAIGSGHVMRCLTLADALHERGAEVHFACRSLRGHLNALVRERGYVAHVLPEPRGLFEPRPDLAHASWLEVDEARDRSETEDVLGRIGGADLLVVDNYALDARWESAMRRRAGRILAIDDLADRRHDADWLLDQNLVSGMQARYDGLVPASCRKLLGPRYTLLRPEFARYRAALRPRDGTVRRLHVSLGGVDADNLTMRVLAALDMLGLRALQVDVVAGVANPHASSLRERCAGQEGWRFHQATSRMAQLMAEADLAVGAGGATTWERACLGLPALILVLGENQRLAALAMSSSGCAAVIAGEEASAERLAQAISDLLAAPERLRDMARCNLELVDGLGAGRVLRALGY
jgi:UDP-2,4-diacetamido-2,4,6-trideoxy-beta-L-altropyranose hydrolase